ncbi:SRPBCC family protein [Rhodococcus triatomae]|nr:hypothetical protein G419_06472 [Rhodococcus triatomae BKS 15-14]
MTHSATWDTDAPPGAVWGILADGWTFPGWVVGAARIRAVDDGWPAVGTRLHHSVGCWPLLLDDRTEVLRCVPGSALTLRARAVPFGLAEVELCLESTERGCHVEMIEHVVSWPVKLLPDAVQEWAVAPRNRECLRRLALIAERATERTRG